MGTGTVANVEQFSTRIKVRFYECDPLGHLNHAAYHSYAEVARLEWMDAHAEGDWRKGSVAAVLLETNAKFKREIRMGDVVDVTCDVTFGERKVFHMDSEIRKADGTVSAVITCVIGMMDLERRKLVDDPRVALKSLGVDV